MISFATQFGHEPAHIDGLNASGASAAREQPLSNAVGQGLPVQSQDDADRAERIRHHTACREAALEEWGKHGNFHDRACADYHQIQIDREIALGAEEGSIG